MKIAAIQMISSADPGQNLDTASRLIQQAHEAGAKFVLLPEYWPIMGMHETDKLKLAEAFGHGRMQEFMAQTAQKLGIWLVGGTIPLISDDPEKIWNATLVYDPEGRQTVRYDKIHLFGFTQGQESYQESRTIRAGKDVVSFDAGFGAVALSVCYDLRFPELYRSVNPCSLIVVPAAFTYTTGQAHWEILLRARAIENQCYVLASAQGGQHQNGRRTWGHSMLIDPWGRILDVCAEGEGIISGELDLDLLHTVRANLPALQHRVLP